MDLKFRTCAGVSVPAVSVTRMREIDRIAMEETGPNLYQMMENAGRNAAEFLRLKCRDVHPQGKILVIAGRGGNGGGGICAARHLANSGLAVDVLIMDEKPPGEVVAWQLHVLRSTQASIFTDRPSQTRSYVLVLDALIGYGLSGVPERRTTDVISWLNDLGVPVLSLDVPSGMDADSAAAPGVAVAPTWTLTLALPKRGLHSPYTGELYLGDIGIPMGLYRRLGLEFSTPFADKSVVRLVTNAQRNSEE